MFHTRRVPIIRRFRSPFGKFEKYSCLVLDVPCAPPERVRRCVYSDMRFIPYFLHAVITRYIRQLCSIVFNDNSRSYRPSTRRVSTPGRRRSLCRTHTHCSPFVIDYPNKRQMYRHRQPGNNVIKVFFFYTRGSKRLRRTANVRH